MEKLDDDHLPPKEEFDSKLYNEDISNEEYAHGKNVCQTFNIRDIREYHLLYREIIRLTLNTFFNYESEFLY